MVVSHHIFIKIKSVIHIKNDWSNHIPIASGEAMFSPLAKVHPDGHFNDFGFSGSFHLLPRLGIKFWENSGKMPLTMGSPPPAILIIMGMFTVTYFACRGLKNSVKVWQCYATGKTMINHWICGAAFPDRPRNVGKITPFSKLGGVDQRTNRRITQWFTNYSWVNASCNYAVGRSNVSGYCDCDYCIL